MTWTYVWFFFCFFFLFGNAIQNHLHSKNKSAMTEAVCPPCHRELDRLGGKHSWFLRSLPAFSSVPKTKVNFPFPAGFTHWKFKSNKCPCSKVGSSSWLLPVFCLNTPDNKKINSFSVFFQVEHCGSTSFSCGYFLETTCMNPSIYSPMWRASWLTSVKWKMYPLCCCWQ